MSNDHLVRGDDTSLLRRRRVHQSRSAVAARRQVNHGLAPPVDAERLIRYEVYVPRRCWSGWPPHCHDGFGGSRYLEDEWDALGWELPKVCP